MKRTGILLLFCVLVSSCHVQKRQHLRGFYVAWKGKGGHPAASPGQVANNGHTAMQAAHEPLAPEKPVAPRIIASAHQSVLQAVASAAKADISNAFDGRPAITNLYSVAKTQALVQQPDPDKSEKERNTIVIVGTIVLVSLCILVAVALVYFFLALSQMSCWG